MGYRILPRTLTLGLTANEAYTYFCLLTCSDFNTYVSHVKLYTLSTLTNIKKREYITKHINTFIDKGLVIDKEHQIRFGNKGCFNTCSYHLFKPVTDWVRINTDLLNADIPNKLKGFLILLKCLCINNSSYIPYLGNDIGHKLSISKATVNKYINQCIELDLIKKEKSGYSLKDNHLFIVDSVKGEDDYYTMVHLPVAEFLKLKGVLNYDKDIVPKISRHFSNPDFIIEALKNRPLPANGSYTWNYLAKVLNVDVSEKRVSGKKSNIIL